MRPGARSNCNVLVGTDTSGFESLGRQLLILVGDQVDAGGEVVNVGLLTTQVEDTNLGVGNTTVEPGLGVGLYDANACQYSILQAVATKLPP